VQKNVQKKQKLDKKIEKQLNKIETLKNEIVVANPIVLLHQAAPLKNATAPVSVKNTTLVAHPKQSAPKTVVQAQPKAPQNVSSNTTSHSQAPKAAIAAPVAAAPHQQKNQTTNKTSVATVSSKNVTKTSLTAPKENKTTTSQTQVKTTSAPVAPAAPYNPALVPTYSADSFPRPMYSAKPADACPKSNKTKEVNPYSEFLDFRQKGSTMLHG